MKKYFISFVMAGLLGMGACKKNYDYNFSTSDGVVKYPINWQAAADSSTDFLVKNYWNSAAGYFYKDNNGDNTFNYWPQAHALDVMLDADVRNGTKKYAAQYDLWFTGVPAKNGGSFLNQFYDDMEWNALALLRAYDVTSDTKFKDAAGTVWTNIKGGWNTVQDGGISWNKSETGYKNTPANAPACILAARLYTRFSNADDLSWAKNIYSWLKGHLYDEGSGFVYDGMNKNGDGAVDMNAFTYNQGVLIGAALELYGITKDPGYLNDAIKTADNTLNSASLTTSDRLLKDEGQGDGGLFKGIFVRYFTQLLLNKDLPDDTRRRYLSFFKLNAETLWYQGTNKTLGLFGSYWKTAPGATVDLTTEESGCMLIEAAGLLNKNKQL
ncbi:MAG TPA: glycoside hydrolase family 76 protein [Puia sp.]|nr:glycoside hydrolase family 76 protein [Puia sp.]